MNHFRHTLHGFFLISHAVAESLLPGYARGDAEELTTGSLVASNPRVSSRERSRRGTSDKAMGPIYRGDSGEATGRGGET
jgi:hypothetical protein